GRPLRFYLTSFVPLKNYMTPVHAYLAQIPNAPQNSLEVIQANLIEPCANLKDYYKLLARTKVFITDHGDMADQDIINAGCAGTSICLISRNPLLTSLGITYSLHAAAQCVDARFYSFLQGTQKSLFRPSRSLTDFVKHTATPWDREFVSQLYFKIWDMLWQWAITGKEFPEVTEAVFKAPRWEV
ncbi:MAG TPA: hypothetical protein DHV51_02200, partial [Opitutae bacterium]|nr:hypothetical protein [Opitutae bacterium]